MTQEFDAIVLGLGAMGSAAAYQLAKRGGKVLGIDQFSPPHALGSSHGETRITRQAIGEGAQYSPLSLRSYEIWREIERETGADLLTVTGGLIIAGAESGGSDRRSAFFSTTVTAAVRHGIRHELLDTAQLRSRFPQFRVRDGEHGYYEAEAGFLRPQACIAAQLGLAERNGAVLHRDEKALRFVDADGGVRVVTDQAEYRAKNLVVCAGAWLPTLLEDDVAELFKVMRQTLYWFDADAAAGVAPFLPGNFPVFIWRLPGGRGVYGFPAIDGDRGGVKIATEQYEVETAADRVDRDVGDDEIRTMFERFVAPNFPGLSPTCVKAAACLYTVTPDGDFVIDRHPRHPAILLASPCSGHGFKHSAAIGEAAAELALTNRTQLDLTPFALGRAAASA